MSLLNVCAMRLTPTSAYDVAGIGSTPISVFEAMKLVMVD